MHYKNYKPARTTERDSENFPGGVDRIYLQPSAANSVVRSSEYEQPQGQGDMAGSGRTHKSGVNTQDDEQGGGPTPNYLKSGHIAIDSEDRDSYRHNDNGRRTHVTNKQDR